MFAKNVSKNIMGWLKMVIKDFPKLESPFDREEIKDVGYVCVPKFKREFSWILNKNICIPTEKFDGTNVSVVVQDGKIIKVLNRTNIIDLWKAHEHFFNGVKQSVEEKKFVPDFLEDGQYFGELIGKHLNGNPLELEKSVWLPFDYIKVHYCFRFYSDWLDEKKLDDKSSDKELYEAFKGLFDENKNIQYIA